MSIRILFPGLFNRRSSSARLVAIYISESAGKPMVSIDSVEAISGKGLSGDRYCEQQGFWKSLDACQTTLITQIELNKAGKRASSDLREEIQRGAHRRNLVIEGLSIGQLENRLFRIGEAVFRYQKPRPPCAYIDRVAGKGMCKALGKHSGVCAEVVEGGVFSVGDVVKLLE